jgi:GNAT superfamily N-acetyltransferase
VKVFYFACCCLQWYSGTKDLENCDPAQEKKLMSVLSVQFDGPRLVRGDELLACERLSHLCFGGSEADLDVEPPATYIPPKRGGTYVITHQGTPVSQISIFHHRIQLYDGQIRVGSIGGVCTHPDFRGQGFAGQLMEHCTRQLAQEGARLMLISGERGLYTRLGNARTGRYMGFTARPNVDQGQSVASNLLVRPATRADALRCSQLYQAEPVHFVRQVTRYAEALPESDSYIHADFWIIERSGQVVAYLLVGIPWDEMAHPEAGIRHVSEYAGSRLALADALDVLLARGGLKELTWPVAWQDVDLIQLLQARGFPAQLITLPEHTMRIINFPGLMDDLRPILRARLEPSLLRGLLFEQSGPLLGSAGGDTCTIRRGPDCLTLDGAAMTRLIMGDVAISPIIAPGALADVIAAIFPLPSFLPGLNYQ